MRGFARKFFETMNEAEDLSTISIFLNALARKYKDPKYGVFLVHEAVERKDTKYLRLLLEGGFDPNASDGIRPIHIAALRNSPACVSILAKHGADLNATLPATIHEFLQHDNKYHKLVMGLPLTDQIPMSLCSHIDDVSTFRTFIEQGADMNVRIPPDDGFLLISMCADAFLPAATLLLEGGAEVNMRNGQSEFCLYWAVRCRNTPLIRMLVERGADLNLQLSADHGAVTALHQAVSDDARDEFAELLRVGAATDIPDSRGETARELAERLGRHEICQIFGEYASR
ncbi:ankyrin [Thozetella sp. PMI_491]|nr:ankyrin [Thozetella sp. PMI_491]